MEKRNHSLYLCELSSLHSIAYTEGSYFPVNNEKGSEVFGRLQKTHQALPFSEDTIPGTNFKYV